MTDAPPPDSTPRSSLAGSRNRFAARRPGTPDRGATPRMEHVRVTAPDLARRAVVETLHKRLIYGAVGFCLLFAVLAGRLIDVTVIHPIMPDPAVLAAMKPATSLAPPSPGRADIVDRNGVILAVSLPSAELYADPSQVGDPTAIAAKLAGVLPKLDQAKVIADLSVPGKKFVYIDRNMTAAQELAVNRLGIPGLYFENTEKRHYPEGDLAAHILGGVTVGNHGIAGVEGYFDQRLQSDPAPLRLSIDIGIEGIVRQEVEKPFKAFEASGACGIVMSATSGRILAMVSLPDYDAGNLGNAPADERFNRCVTGDYEPGSVFKLQTISMALNSGLIHYWDRFDTTHPLRVGRFTVTDFEPTHKWLAVPEILAVSSNIGASRIATILGPQIQRDWLRKMGFFRKLGVQLPEAQPTLYHPESNWGLTTTMTVSFGNGISVTPLHLVTGVVPIVNGGIRYHPTLLAADPGAPPPQGERVMSPQTSDIMRALMRGVVMSGTGANARVPGYLVGGKTGTAQVVGPNGTYEKHLNNASFMAAFPMNDPRYVIYVVVLKPHNTPETLPFTHGYTTGGYVAAPAVAQIIARIGPMLGIMPMSGQALADAAQALTIPLDPAVPPGQIALGPGRPFPPGANRLAYELAGEKLPGGGDPAHPARHAAPLRGGPTATLSTVHSLARRPGEVMAPVVKLPGAQAIRHETMLTPLPQSEPVMQLAGR